jgi:aldehyde:ferredoxin oxidoreductase
VLVIKGRSKNPVFLWITRDGVQFFPAEQYAGLDARETRDLLKKNYSPKAQVLTIGAAGKNKIRFASVMSDSGKALGRGGGGAVWGSKNLYAVAVIPDPKMKVEVADEESFSNKNQSGAMYPVKLKLDLGKFTKNESMFGILASMGSLGILGMVNHYNQLIHNNMKDTNHKPENIQKISGEALRYHAQNAKQGERKIEVKKGACFNCPIVCKRQTTLIDTNGSVLEKGEGPEFESTTLLGANLSIYDLTVITEANYLANRYGLDTITLGATIASLFELYEFVFGKRKDLTQREKQFLDDVKELVYEVGEPRFGATDILIPLIHLIGDRKGLGNHLAEGSLRFCKRYGHEELSMSIKGLELPAYDPRTSFSQALCYEMNNRGGGHLEGGYTAPHAYCAGYAEWPANRIEGTALISKNATLKNTTLDIIGACAYSSFSLGLDEYASLVNAVTGDKHNSGSLKTIAQRTYTLERIFNLLCGLTHADDWLPNRFFTESIQTKDGPVTCDRSSFEKMHREYYHSFGWDENGKPSLKTLDQLGLLEFIPKDSNLFDETYKRNKENEG